jgi:hypothetical protein
MMFLQSCSGFLQARLRLLTPLEKRGRVTLQLPQNLFEKMQIPVGVSLLAMASCQTPMMLNDTTPSRAGSLLQGIFGESENRTGTKKRPEGRFSVG